MPFSHASSPIVRPRVCCSPGSHVAAWAIGAGKAVVPTCEPATPAGPSFRLRAGMQRAGFPGT